MLSNTLTYGLAAGIVFILFLSVIGPVMGQERDTTEAEKRIRTRPSLPEIEGHSERAIQNFSLPSSGIHQVPEETKYYKPPFMGQHYLDMAVEAYRKEQHVHPELARILRVANMLAPFIYNKFEFGVYQIEDLPIVDRDNPLLKPDQ